LKINRSAGSRYTGSGMNRGANPMGVGSVSSGLGVSSGNPGGGARGSLLVVGTLGVTGTDWSLVGVGTLAASGTEGSLVPGPSGTPWSAAVLVVPSAGVLASSSEEEREPWIGAKGVPGSMTVGTRPDVGTVSSS
jgi:hypothetical protein